jgi:hypothetical protein
LYFALPHLFSYSWVGAYFRNSPIPRAENLTQFSSFFNNFFPVMHSRYPLGMMGEKNYARCSSIRVSPNTLRKILKVVRCAFIEFPSVLAIFLIIWINCCLYNYICSIFLFVLRGCSCCCYCCDLRDKFISTSKENLWSTMATCELPHPGFFYFNQFWGLIAFRCLFHC